MRMIILLFTLAIASIIGQACQNNSNPISATEHPGKAKFDAYCGSCHNSSGAVAPPAIAIQRHYKMKHKTEENFVAAVSEFVLNPSIKKAILKPAVKKFGLMPAMSYPKEDLTLIAQYVYQNTFEKPNDDETASDEPETASLKLGNEITKNTKQLLGKNLMSAIKTEGTVGALAFCNTQAIPLTDSMMNKYHTFIQRVSDKPRNPKNSANEAETEMIVAYQEQLKNGSALAPQLLESNGKKWFYKPIVTNQMCLQCHGATDKNIKPEVLAEIKTRYPEDMATGYDENQVRGMFKVEIKE
jgi:cytochrome c553